MKLIDSVIVAIPETLMILLIGLLLGYNRKFYKKISFVAFRILVATVLIVLAIYIARSRLASIQAIGIFCLLIYTATFKFLFEMNTRKSVMIGSLAMFIIFSTEIVTFPVLKYMTEGNYLENRFNVTLITRVIQFIILMCLYKFKISLANVSMVSRKWDRLKISEKFTMVFVMSLLVLCVVFNASYSDLYIKLHVNNLELGLNMTIYFIENLLFIAITVYILNRTKYYYLYEEILLRGDEEMLLSLLDATNDDDTIRRYIKICETYLDQSAKGVKSNE